MCSYNADSRGEELRQRHGPWPQQRERAVISEAYWPGRDSVGSTNVAGQQGNVNGLYAYYGTALPPSARVKANAPMFQTLTQPAIVVTSEQASFTTAALLRSLVPAAPDTGERSVKRLLVLADLAYKAGDLELAEDLVWRIYAHYDQQRSAVE